MPSKTSLWVVVIVGKEEESDESEKRAIEYSDFSKQRRWSFRSGGRTRLVECRGTLPVHGAVVMVG